MANDPPLKFVMAEFFDNDDANQVKKWWRKLGYQDITPHLPGVREGVVSTFHNKAATAKWQDYQLAVSKLEPDWIFVGGHHGRQFQADWDQAGGQTWYDHVMNQKEVGFFNKWYHDRTWHKNFKDKNEAYEVYMSTARIPVGDLAGDDNPFFLNVHTATKGVILIGCNSLAYPVARKAWAQAFPNALIFGMIGRVTGKDGKPWVRPFLQEAGICGDSLFRNPPSEPDKLAEISYFTNRALPRDQHILRLQRGNLYCEYSPEADLAKTIDAPTGREVGRYPPKK